MKFTNRDRLRRRLKAIPIEVRKAAKGQLAANAAELVATQKRFAPVDDGALQASIRHRDVSDSTRITQRVSAGNSAVPYAAWVEFGTKGVAGEAPRQNRNYRRTEVMTKGSGTHHATEPHPFFWAAYRLLRRRFRARMTKAAKKAVQGAIT